MSQGTEKQRKAFDFLRARKGRSFSAADLATATGYAAATAETNLSQHWASVIERKGDRWAARSIVTRMTLREFLDAIAQSKRVGAAHESRTYLLLDASAVAPYYVPQATKSEKLTERITILMDSVRAGQNSAFLYMPNFAIAETFGVFMKHGFSAWNKQVKNKLTRSQYLDAVERFQNDIHNGRLIYQYELNRYHILGINLVGPVDYHYQMVRPKRQHPAKRRAPKPAGTSDQLIVSMGVQLAHLHGSPNTVVVTADRRLADLIEKCRKPMKPEVRSRLGLNRCKNIVGREFAPETFPNVIDLQRAPRWRASQFVGTTLSR